MTTNLGADFSGNAPANADEAKKALDSAQGRLIAWDPVAQKEVWRVERGGPSNGGALSTAGGIVFQGTGGGEFTALDAKSGATLWSTPVQTGVIAAPMTYELGGKQYVAIVVGSGGSWRMIGGDQNTKGNHLPNISRVLVFSIGGTAKLPPAPAPLERKLSPPPATATAKVVGEGAGLYGTYCQGCHGPGTINLGILPDVRYSTSIRSAEAFKNIVLGGALEEGGMASFSPVLDDPGSEAIRAFIIAQAHAAQANATK